MIENSMCNDITSEQFDIEQELYAKEQELIRIDYSDLTLLYDLIKADLIEVIEDE